VNAPIHVVTGAFGYSGRYIAQRLLACGLQVRTLTNSPGRESPLAGRVAVFPYAFDDPVMLTEALRGAAVLYNTYWVRFSHRGFSFTSAETNTRALFAAARAAGVGRVVHVSITNPSEDSPLEYFRRKARLERALIEEGLSYAILRPAVLFGGPDILINNIAWMLRRMPVFGIFGDGAYRIRPIHVEDLAALAVRLGQTDDNCVVDAVGPESFTFRELVEKTGRIIGCPRPIVSLPPWLGLLVARLLGIVLGDVVLTAEEIRGLMAGLLDTDSPATGTTRFTEWAAEHAADLGTRYASELARRRDRRSAYERL
jgi:uncharacterized protein YbjT (DUF2867 family)